MCLDCRGFHPPDQRRRAEDGNQSAAKFGGGIGFGDGEGDCCGEAGCKMVHEVFFILKSIFGYILRVGYLNALLSPHGRGEKRHEEKSS